MWKYEPLAPDMQTSFEAFVDECCEIQGLDKVYSIDDWILYSIKGMQPDVFPLLFPKTRKLCRIYQAFNGAEIPPLASYPDQDYPLYTKAACVKPDIIASQAYENVIRAMVESDVTEGFLQRLPYGMAFPILEIIRHLRQNPPTVCTQWPDSALKMINRDDIYLNRPERRKLAPTKDQQYEQILELELHREPNETPNEPVSNYIFETDLRYEEIEYMLNPTTTMKMKMQDFILSEELFENEKQNLMHKMCVKRASSCVGFGAMTAGTARASTISTSEIPAISYQATLPPNFETKMTLSSEELNNKEKDFTLWPEFHLGVATGLKMLSDNPQHYIKNRQWISFHRGEDESNEHAGFILALGLMGQLEALHDLDVYRYLRAEREAVTIAIYLGKSASAIGSMDEKTMRFLRISIAFLIPQYVDIDTKLTHEAASMVGFGLLYKGSANRQVTEMLLT